MHQLADRGAQGDGELLRAFVSDGSQEAFRALVEKYLGLVRGITRRRLSDAGLAEEVAQNVFTILARKAKGLKAGPTLSGWIHRVTVIECADALRRESSQRTRMHAVSTQLLTEFEGRETWREALPLLDEGIDALSHGERAVVMLRFFERKSFREVGTALGKSEDAAQKQCERALQRLAAFLQKRGAQLTIAALGAGLGSLLPHSCTAAATAAMTRGALTAASTFDAKISILKAIEAMTRTKLQTAILVTAILAVPLALQWTENKQLRESLDALAQRSGPTLPIDADHSAAITGAKLLAQNRSSERPGVAEPDAAALPAAIGGGESDVVEWKRALFLTDPLQRSQRLSELLSRLRAEDAPAIAAGFEEARAGGIQFAEEHRLFLRAWGKIGGVAAVEHALKQNGQGSAEAVAALGGWASNSAGPARAWLEALPENEAKDALVYGLLDGWSTTDFAAAAAYAESRPVSPARDRFRELLLERALRAHGVGGAQDWVQRIPEDEHNREYKKRAFGEVVQAMLYRDPAAAARWISEMDGRNFVDAETVTSTAAKLAESSPTGALQWLAGLKPADANGVAKGAGTVLQQWAQQDPQAAGSWLQQNTAHPFYDRLALGYVRSVVSTDRDGASKWAETIRDEQLRGKATAALAPETLISDSFITFSDTKAGNGRTLTFTSGLMMAGKQTLVLDENRGESVRLNVYGEEPHELALEKAIYAATMAKAADLTLAKKNPHSAGPQWKNCAQCHAQ